MGVDIFTSVTIYTIASRVAALAEWTGLSAQRHGCPGTCFEYASTLRTLTCQTCPFQKLYVWSVSCNGFHGGPAGIYLGSQSKHRSPQSVSPFQIKKAAMISQQYARHNERPVTNRTIEDRRHLRLIQTVRITMANF